ncbi:hypothetical protein IKF32_00705 [Candidatus Saccharibacteria bacterium]|nr:hypothetical protein [Candidatus Saccharibacteria bacterium]
MTSAKKKKIDKPTHNEATVGFLPDFSLYLKKYYPINKVYSKPVFIKKLGDILKEIITEENPSFELQKKGFCSKFEKMDPRQDKEFFTRLAGIGEKAATIHPYYSSFGNNGYGIAVYLDPVNRHAYFLALDVEHRIRRFHGKLG